jgi:hypothetical protein
MANPTYFTVVADFKSVVVDLASDVDADPQLGPVTAKVTFTPVLANGDVILAGDATPRPTLFVPAPIVARIDTDGRLKLRVAPDGDRDDFANIAAFPGTGNTAKVYFAINTQKFYRWTGSTYAETYPYAPVRLLADTPLLDLASDLYYRVTFSEVVFNGASGYINGFTFEAPKTDSELNLVYVARVPGQPASGVTKGARGDRGYSFVGLAPAGDGTSVVGLAESESGVVPAGDPIPISLSYNSTVTHSNIAYTPRPPVSVAVIWIGSVEPNNAIDGDVWLDTSGTAPSIVSSTIDGLNIGLAVNQLLVATGTTPIIWSLYSGTLPAGLTLSTGGSLYGTPTTSGAYSFTLKALNGFGDTTQAYTGSVGSAVAPTINTTTVGSLTAGQAESVTLSVTGSTTITFAVQSGSLPTGMSLNSATGVISGTPSAIGAYSFTIRATNSVGYDDQAFTGTVTGIAPTITSTSIGALYRANAFSATLATTGTAPITFAVQSGSLPAGLSLNTSTGVISGTPTTVASYTFTIRATNSYGTNEKSFTVAVLQSTPSIVETTLLAMSTNASFSQTLTLSTGGPTITWSIQSGSLPAGLSLNSSNGAITGTPTAGGSYSVSIRATNGTDYDDQAFTGTVIGARPTLDVVGTGYAGTGTPSATLTVAGGTGNAVLAWVSMKSSTAITGLTASCGGASMTLLGSLGGIGSATTKIWVFGLLNPSAGSKSVTFSITGGGTTYKAVNAVSYNGVGSFGTPVSTTGSGTSLSHSVTSSSARLVAQSFMTDTVGVTIDSYSQTSRANYPGVNGISLAFMFGDGPGASSTSFTGTVGSSSPWGSLAVELLPRTS